MAVGRYPHVRWPLVNVFSDARGDIAGKLAAAGVDYVTFDPRAQAPCVLVDVPMRNDPGVGGIGGWTVEIPVRIIVPPPGDADAAAWLLDQLEPVMAVYPFATFEAGTVNRGDADLPAYTVTVTTQIPNPTC